MTHILSSGFLFFILVFVTHRLIWHLSRLKKEIFWLIFLFLVVPSGGLLWVGALGYYRWSEIIATATLYFALALVYLQTYPALKTEIPSFKILRLIHSHREEGIAESRILEALHSDQELFLEKMEELKKDALVFQYPDGQYELTAWGGLVASAFIFYRRLLGLKWGQG